MEDKIEKILLAIKDIKENDIRVTFEIALLSLTISHQTISDLKDATLSADEISDRATRAKKRFEMLESLTATIEIHDAAMSKLSPKSKQDISSAGMAHLHKK